MELLLVRKYLKAAYTIGCLWAVSYTHLAVYKRQILKKDTRMAFITAAMGGGTGTGAAPVIAKLSKDMGILTVGIVSVPARFEGPKRLDQARDGLRRLKDHVDCLIVIDNEKIKSTLIYPGRVIISAIPLAAIFSTSLAFAKACDIVCDP